MITYMPDATAIAAIIVSILTALGGFAAALHIKRMKSGCCSCETVTPDNSVTEPVHQNTPNITPMPSPNFQRKDLRLSDV
jgi:hypothetical protein